MTAIPQAATARGAEHLDASHLALLAGTFAVTFDFFVVNLALPTIAAELGSGAALTQWIVAGFGLVYGAGLLVGSRIGERFGATRSFRAGLVLFLAGSMACALSTDAGVLVAARCLQGGGAALLSPQVMSLLGRLAPDALRLRGFAGYGVALGLGSGLGQVVGGLLVDPQALANIGLRRAIATVLLFYCGNASFFYVVSMYLQQGRGLAPLAAALVFTLMVAGFLATSVPSRRISARLGAATLPVGSLVGAAGHASLAVLVPAQVGVWALAPSLILTGAGIGIVMGPLIARAIAAADPRFTALAAGLVGSAQWIGNAVGVALIGTFYIGIATTGAVGASARAAANCHWVFAALSVIVAVASTRWREWSRPA